MLCSLVGGDHLPQGVGQPQHRAGPRASRPVLQVAIVCPGSIPGGIVRPYLRRRAGLTPRL